MIGLRSYPITTGRSLLDYLTIRIEIKKSKEGNCTPFSPTFLFSAWTFVRARHHISDAALPFLLDTLQLGCTCSNLIHGWESGQVPYTECYSLMT